MSRTVDERVVSMQFDNKNFEQNARTSMSTLDKLKQKLNLSGAAKGLNEVHAASKKINFSEMENAAYKSGFHIQDIWLKTASVLEYQVAGKIVNAAKNMLNALTVAPVGDGFKEYEMTLNAVQTTMAGTGKTAEEVEKELKKLDEYADKTVYSTADMLNNLPKFTNAGVELEQATKAMIGIANATALAGGDAGKASIAFYNLGQAIGTGYLTRMDYNSINDAGIATMEWKNAMVEAAIAQGTLTKVGEDAYQAGNKTLTLQQLFIDGLQEQWATTDVMMKVFGDYGDETTAIGEKAYSAAQDIKTFTMMMDSLKATAGTGWKDTWQIIFGGLDEAKEFWTGLTNFISNIITTLDDWRNNFLATALQSPFKKIAEGMKKIGETATKVTQPVKDLSEIVDRVINGEFGNTQQRWDQLTALGYDWIRVQNLVNEKLGNSYRRQETVNEVTEEAVEVQSELNDAILKEIGLTEEEIEVYKKLQEISGRTGIPLEEINGRLLLIESFRNIGKSLVGVFEQLKNAWTDTFSPLRPVQLLNLIDKFHQFTEALKVNHEQSYKLYRTFKGLFAIIDIVATIAGGAFRIAFEIAKELLSYFNLDILDLTAAIGDIAVRIRNWIKSLIDVEGIVQVIGPLIERAVNAVRGWIDSIKQSQAFNTFVDRIRKVTGAIKEWFAGMKDAENLPQYIANGIGTAIGTVLKVFRDMIGKISDFVTGGFKDIPGHMTDGFIGGLWDGIKRVGQTMLEFGKTIINKVKEVLGIHSPSKVFFAIAGFVISGFVLGLRDKIGTVWPALGEFANGVVDFVKNIPFGKIFATAGSVAVLAFAASIAKAFGSLAGVFDGLGDILNNAADVVKIFGKTVNRLGKAVSNSLNAMAFKQLAISIAILVGSIVVLTLLDPNKMWQAVGVIAALAGIMGALFVVVNKLGSSKNPLADKTTVIDFSKMALGLFAIAGAIMIMAIAAKMIGDMDDAALIKAGIGITVLAGVMVGLLAATRLMAKTTAGNVTKDVLTVGKMLVGMAAAILIMVIAAKIIASMEWSEMAKAGTGLIVLAGIMVGLIAATKLVAKTEKGNISTNLTRIGKMLLSIAAGILILVIAAKIIAGMDWNEMGKAGVGLAALAGIMVGLIAATKLLGKNNIADIGKTLLSISAGILLLVVAAKIIAGMSWGEMGKAAVGIAALAGVMVGLVAATKLAGGNDLKGVAATLIAMAGAIAVMAITALILSMLDIGALAKGVAAVGLLALIAIGMVKATEKAKNVKGTIIAMAIAIGVMAAAIAVLSFIDPGSLASASLAIGLLMGMFALMTSQAGKAKKAMPAIYAMVAAVAVMGLAIGLLSLLPVQNVLGSAVALGALMLAMSGVIAILGKACGGAAGKNALRGVILLAALAVPLLAFTGILALMSGVQNALTNVIALSLLAGAMTVLLIPLSAIGKAPIKDIALGILSLTLMAVPLIAFVGVLAVMQNVQNAMTNVQALTVLATAMTLLLIPLSVIGILVGATGGMMLLGIVALTAMALPLLAFVGVLAIMQNIQNATGNVMLLVALMTTLTDMLVKVSIVAPLAIIAVVAIAALVGVITAIGILATAIGALMTQFPQLEEFMNKGLPILERLAGSIGTMIGNFIAGFVGGVAEALPHLGLCLSQFMTNAMPFIAGAKMVDESVLVGVGILAGSVLALTAADVISGIASFLGGGTSFADLGTELSQFMINAMPFIMAAKLLDPAMMEGVRVLADTILTLTGTDILDSLTSWLTGGSSLADFGAQLAPFGGYLKTFADAVAGIDVEAVRVAAEAGKTLAEMANTIPNEGGVVGWFAGENSLGAFGPQIVTFGQAIAGFSSAVSGVNVEAVRTACEAGKALTEMAGTIPNQGGIAAWFAGENSLAAFAPQISNFGKAIAGFSTSVGGVNVEAVRAACDAGKALTAMANTIPNQGGVKSWFSGDNSLAAFGPQIASFGKHLKAFSDNVSGVRVASITAAAEAGKTLAEMANMVPSGASLVYFGDQLTLFGESMADFADGAALIDVGSLTKTITAFKDVMRKISEVGKDGIKGFIDAFKNAKPQVEAAGTALAKAALKGLESTNIRTKFTSAGKALADGFADGISANAFKAQARAVAMAQAALAAAKAILRINSPSKAFRDMGMSVPEGFAMGIDKLGGLVKNSAVDMADGAIDGTKTAIARIADAINSDIDTQPTIRPVLDLSDVRSGATSLSGMLSMTPSVGVLANVGAISSMMNNRQNGGNSDVVSALNDLKSSLSGRTGDTYTIAGITYDDGSNVSEAVKSLVRAARIERRV